MTLRRYLEASVREDLAEKMVFVAGPRQVGKTTMARQILSEWSAGMYLNWDNRQDRSEIRAACWPAGNALLVFDELHKWRGWKGWIKGEYDKHRERLRFLVTGSARLDVYRRGGDSLQGRYHHYRLHPLSYAEVEGQGNTALPEPGRDLRLPPTGSRHLVASLMEYGGFPEPFLAHSERSLRRWQKERLDRFFREDVRDLESIRDLSTIQILADLLPERVGSQLSLNAIREDLDATHGAVTLWMDILERLYHTFRIRPYVSPRVRSLKMMPKAYLWDTSLVPAPGPRFENLVALHLLKLCHLFQDREGHDAQLHYLRDRAGHEVDFLLTLGRRPWLAVEAKVNAQSVEPALFYFRERLRIPYAYQVVLDGSRDYVQDGVRFVPAAQFLAGLV
ncbi:MAG: ATP-binding protein [Acidobacteriota bacterium]